jgi:hypothetical protein
MSFVARNLAVLTRNTRVIGAAVLYNALVFLVFLCIYSLMDFNGHFASDERSDDRSDERSDVTARGKLYFAVMTHTGGNTNGIRPVTDAGRMLQALHVTLAWMQLVLVVFLAPHT